MSFRAIPRSGTGGAIGRVDWIDVPSFVLSHRREGSTMTHSALAYTADLTSPISGRPELPKRVFDVMVATAALVLLAPLFLLVAVLIKLTDRGPVFFVQQRIGKDGVPFPFLKFRSMVVNADALKAT